MKMKTNEPGDCMNEQKPSNPNSRLQQLVKDLNDNHVTGIGTRAGYFAAVPKLTFGLVSFDLENSVEPNPRVIDDHLHLDLWFNTERTVDVGVLAERISHNRHLIKQTVVLTDIDYINKDKTRIYY